MLRLCLSALIFAALCFPAYAGDASESLDKTPSMAIVQMGGATKGEFTLEVSGQLVSAAYLPQTFGETRGSIILLHDQDVQFDSPLLHHLREDLAEFGWDTLTVSLAHERAVLADISEKAEPTEPSVNAEPLENNDAALGSINDRELENNASDQRLLPSNAERLDAAIAWLMAKNPPNLIILGHGAGVQTAINAISATPQPISAAVLISSDASMTAAQIIDANLPVLEIIGSRINSVSFESARMRHSQLKNQANQTYSQRLIYGGNRDFQGMESVLSKQVHSWLYRQLISDVQR